MHNEASDPVDFWVYFLKSPLIQWEGDIKQLIKIVLTLSPTTAQVERAFSIMSHVVTNRRRTLTSKHVEYIMRIHSNGPSIKDFDPKTYVIHWLTSGHSLIDSNRKSDPKETGTRISNLF